MILTKLLTANPSIYPLALNDAGELAFCIELSEEDYREASFLDDRVLRANQGQGVIRWQELESAAASLPLQCNFIFHTSHAGSTLISRLLGAHSSIFALREPSLLRSFGKGKHRSHMDKLLRLWSRTYHPGQKSLIKATSFVSEIAEDLLMLVMDSKAILIYVPLETFLPTMLDGAMSDIHSEAGSRLQRLKNRGRLSEVVLSSLSPGEYVAMSWFSEMVAMQSVARKFPDRTLWFNFDDFLLDPERHLGSAFLHLGVHVEPHSILASPIMTQYAKKPEVRYDSSFRSKLLAEAREKYVEEISRGLAWFNSHSKT